MNKRLTQLLHFILVTLQSVLSVGAAAFAVVMLAVAIDGPLQPFLAMFVTAWLVFFAVCVHEGGHWLGARLAGMRVLQAKALGLEVLKMQRGVRLRWARRVPGQPFSGYVLAVGHPGQPMREPMMLSIAMGPALNLIVAAIFFVVFAFVSWPYAGWPLTFAVINLAMGLANLIPTFQKGQRDKPHSDGAKLISWWQKPDESSPEFAFLRLMTLSVSGVPSGEVPLEELRQLDELPMPMPTLSLAYRLEARLVAGDWNGALSLGDDLEGMIAAEPSMLVSLATHIAALRRQLEFCRAIAQGDAGTLAVPIFNRDLNWHAPALAPCCRALCAALAGDRAGMEQELAAVEGFARNSQWRSSYLMYLALADHIRAARERFAADNAITGERFS